MWGGGARPELRSSRYLRFYFFNSEYQHVYMDKMDCHYLHILVGKTHGAKLTYSNISVPLIEMRVVCLVVLETPVVCLMRV